MSTTIDSLQIDIQTSSSNAAGGIDQLAASLERLKKVGSFNVVIKNLNNLSAALGKLQSSSAGLAKLNALAASIESIKKAGSFGSIGTSFAKLGTALESLEKINIDGVVSKMEELDKKLGPVSKKLIAIGDAFKAVNSSTAKTTSGFTSFSGRVNTTTLNLSSMINVLRGVKSVLMPIVNLLKSTISDAIEWEGIAQRFGRGFGDQADEVYSWVQRLNKEMGINTQQFMQYSSTYATMLNGFGVASKDASKMALGYMELTYDIWAGYNDIYKSLDDAATAVRSAIAGEVEPVRKAGFTIIESTLEQTAANHGLKISLEKATEAQKSYLRYLAMVDQAKAQGLVGNYAREMNTAEGAVRTFTQQLKSLAQTFGSIFLPILVKVMPWLQAFVSLIGDAIMAVAAFFNIDIQKANFGSSGFDDMGASASGAGEAVKDATQAVKDLKNATLGIDELNIISPQTSSGGAGGASGGGSYDFDVDSLWDQSIFDSIQFEVNAIKEQLKEALSGIEAVVSGFALAIGAILTLSGNPKTMALGIGLLAVGAVGMVHAITVNWNGMGDKLAKTLTIVTGVVSGFLLALGACFTFTGSNVGLGIALMAAGAVGLGTAVSMNWKFLEGNFKSTLSILTGILSGGMLAIGAGLAFTGANLPLGIALLAAGAVGLATTIGLNWNSMSAPMGKAIGTLEAIVGGAMLVIGCILAFTGANIPLGVGLMAAGAVSLVSAVAMNWDSLTGDVKKRISTITAIVSGALIGIGAVLAFTGAALPLGIALMALGAAGIVATASLNWNAIVDGIKNVLKEIGIAVGAALLALGILLVCTGVGVPVGIGLIAAGATSLVAGIALNWNYIVDTIKNVLKKIGIAVGAASLAIGVLLCLTGVGIPLGIGLIVAGVSGIVAGVALNWDTFKDIGTRCVDGIVSGFSNLKNKAKEIFSNFVQGVKDFLGIRSPSKAFEEIGNYCMQGLTNSMGKNTIKDKLVSAWNTAKDWWNRNVKLSIPSLSFKVTYTTEGLGTIKKAIVNALGLPGWPKLSFAANGGIFDMGSLVWAGEAGPEIVANAGGGKTGVMNVQQMSEAVYEGVYSAVIAAMRASESGGSQSVNVYLDGRQVYASMEQHRKERGASLMGNQVYSY